MLTRLNNPKFSPLESNSGAIAPGLVSSLAGFFLLRNLKMAQKIPLTQGKFAIVDNELFGWLNKYKWYALWRPNIQNFYAVRNSKIENGKRFLIYMAREILGLTYGDKRQADHIDHNTLDNRIAKLRIVTQQQNQWNQKNRKGYSRRNNYYRARIRLNGKLIYLGTFLNDQEARNAYLRAKEQCHTIC